MADERWTVSKAEESQPEAPRPHVVGQGPNYTSGELVDLSLRVLGISNKAEESYQSFFDNPKSAKTSCRPRLYDGECIDTLFTGARNFLTRLKRAIELFW